MTEEELARVVDALAARLLVSLSTYVEDGRTVHVSLQVGISVPGSAEPREVSRAYARFTLERG